ncbi:uncharacterized protein LOC123696079 [Colias croceus]|uniref:uncharacterized protein LOC123696079 n=1 Tax=Colias crocea TaxID=72248 RepID=UPI001E27B79A|nr:uncharacterized protein LOC123696079 [Colias croceus]
MDKNEKLNSDEFKQYISEEDIKIVTEKYFGTENVVAHTYSIEFASKHIMLGFLCDYLKLSINARLNNEEIKNVSCFIKSISKSNKAKAAMVQDLKLFDKELKFYTLIKDRIQIPGLKWSPELILGLKDAMVFENLNTLGYRVRNKLKTFDKAHTLQALRTLARLHASTIIYEERKSRDLNLPYSINDEFETYLDEGGYHIFDPWYIQCMSGALEVIKSHSKYAKDDHVISKCTEKWTDVWKAALELGNYTPKYRNVICHRDLWNNNMLFHYSAVNGLEVPDDCLLVDFQAVRYHPPAGDIMLLLYCNLERDFREENLKLFLNFYYDALEMELSNHDILIRNVLTLDELFKSAEEYRLWGLVLTACLVPQFWLDDELTTKIFSDSAQFEEILSKNKAKFIKKMIDEDVSYKEKVLGIFEEIVTEYCIDNKD